MVNFYFSPILIRQFPEFQKKVYIINWFWQANHVNSIMTFLLGNFTELFLLVVKQIIYETYVAYFSINKYSQIAKTLFN